MKSAAFPVEAGMSKSDGSALISNIHASIFNKMLPDRNNETVATYLSQLPGRESVKHVAFDLRAPCCDAMYVVMLQVKVELDKSHLSRIGSEAM
jgi:transposase